MQNAWFNMTLLDGGGSQISGQWSEFLANITWPLVQPISVFITTFRYYDKHIIS